MVCVVEADTQLQAAPGPINWTPLHWTTLHWTPINWTAVVLEKIHGRNMPTSLMVPLMNNAAYIA